MSFYGSPRKLNKVRGLNFLMKNKKKTSSNPLEVLQDDTALKIWISCIDEERNIEEVKKIWNITDNTKPAVMRERLKKYNLVHSYEKKTKTNTSSYPIRSCVEFITDIPKEEFLFMPLNMHFFFNLSQQDKIRILNSDAFRKGCMNTGLIKTFFDSNEKLKHDWFNETVSNIEKKKFSNYIMKYIRKFPNNLSFFSFLSRGLSILSMCKSIERKYIKIEDLDNSEFCKSCKIAYKIIGDHNYVIPIEIPVSELRTREGSINFFVTIILEFYEDHKEDWEEIKKRLRAKGVDI